MLRGVPSIPQGPSEDWVTISQAFPQPLLEPAGPDLQAALGGAGGEKANERTSQRFHFALDQLPVTRRAGTIMS